MTPAMQKLDAYRDSFALSAGTKKLVSPTGAAVVYLKDLDTKRGKRFGLVAFSGRKKKHDLATTFAAREYRAKWVREFFAAKESRAEKAKPKARALAVGDVLKASWGYEQTNIDFFKVVALKGKTMVGLVEIGKMIQRDENNDLTGLCVPDVAAEKGEIFYRKADGKSVKICDVFYASRYDDYTEVLGARVYKGVYWSAYH